jgi:adenylate cyclase
VHVFPEAISLPVEPRKSLLELCLANRIPLTHACGGLARCSTCRVVVLDGAAHCTERSPAERDLAARFGFDDHIRLACQTRISGPARVRRLVLDEHDENVVEGAAAGKIAALGEEIVAAILFCDIRGFTRFAQRVLPYDAIHLLNRFYAMLGPHITKNGGEINNTMGDGFLAIFPHADEPTSCQGAVRAGLALLAAMPTLSDYATRAYGEELRIGVGIHSGPVIRGTIGHGTARRVTVIGDNVNLASRIESATKQLGKPLLVSPRVRRLDRDHEWQEAGIAHLQGVVEPIPLHSPVI